MYHFSDNFETDGTSDDYTSCLEECIAATGKTQEECKAMCEGTTGKKIETFCFYSFIDLL